MRLRDEQIKLLRDVADRQRVRARTFGPHWGEPLIKEADALEAIADSLERADKTDPLYIPDELHPSRQCNLGFWHSGMNQN